MHNDTSKHYFLHTLWRYQMETFSALLAICAGNSWSPVNSSHKGQLRGALMFSLSWIHGWVNNGEVGDLRRHGAHYDATVMTTTKPATYSFQPLWLNAGQPHKSNNINPPIHFTSKLPARHAYPPTRTGHPIGTTLTQGHIPLQTPPTTRLNTPQQDQDHTKWAKTLLETISTNRYIHQ